MCICSNNLFTKHDSIWHLNVKFHEILQMNYIIRIFIGAFNFETIYFDMLSIYRNHCDSLIRKKLNK